MQKAGYAGTGLSEFLTRLAERNKGQAEKNGLFASHPETQERIGKVKQLAGSKPGAVVAARYTSTIKYQPTPLTSVATVVEGSAGLTGGGKAPAKPEEKKAEEKKKGFGLSNLTKSATAGKNEQQVAASGGARGLGADRLAKGGDNPNPVKPAISPADRGGIQEGDRLAPRAHFRFPLSVIAGLALLVASLALRGATINRHIRGRLLLSASLFATFTLAAIALHYLPLADDMRRLLRDFNPLVMAFAVINLVVALTTESVAARSPSRTLSGDRPGHAADSAVRRSPRR